MDAAIRTITFLTLLAFYCTSAARCIPTEPACVADARPRTDQLGQLLEKTPAPRLPNELIADILEARLLLADAAPRHLGRLKLVDRQFYGLLTDYIKPAIDHRLLRHMKEYCQALDQEDRHKIRDIMSNNINALGLRMEWFNPSLETKLVLNEISAVDDMSPEPSTRTYRGIHYVALAYHGLFLKPLDYSAFIALTRGLERQVRTWLRDAYHSALKTLSHKVSVGRACALQAFVGKMLGSPHLRKITCAFLERHAPYEAVSHKGQKETVVVMGEVLPFLFPDFLYEGGEQDISAIVYNTTLGSKNLTSLFHDKLALLTHSPTTFSQLFHDNLNREVKIQRHKQLFFLSNKDLKILSTKVCNILAPRSLAKGAHCHEADWPKDRVTLENLRTMSDSYFKHYGC